MACASTVGLVLLVVVSSYISLVNCMTLHVSPDSIGTTCSSASPCSLRRALAVATDGDFVVLEAGNYGQDDCGLNLNTSGISIQGPSFPVCAGFDSAGIAVFDCEDSNRFVEIRGGAQTPTGVNFSNLFIRNSHYNGTLHGSDGGIRGGAFNFVEAGTQAEPISLRNIHVLNSKVTGEGWSTTGGCLNVINAHVNVESSSFTDCINTNGRLSGAVYIKADSPDRGKLTVTASSFTRARGDVGGSVLTEGSQNSEFTRCNFTDSYAKYGGSIDSGNDSNTTFTACRYGQAGTRFIDCTSEDTYASMNGGIFFFTSQTTTYISGFHGVNATAIGDGGVIRHASRSAHAFILNSVFDGSRAGRAAGFSSEGGRGIHVENVLMKNAIALIGDGSFFSYPDIVKNVTFEDNSGRTSARFLYNAQDRSDATVVRGMIRDVTLIGCRGRTEGVLTVEENYVGCASLDGLTMRDSSGYSGGIHVGENACADINGIEMTNNTASHAGSMFYASPNSLPSSISNGRFEHNSVQTANSFSGCAGTSSPSGGLFLGNVDAQRASSGGAAVGADSCPSWVTSAISLYNTTFRYNTADGAGALIYIDSTLSDSVLSGCTFESFCTTNCSAAGNQASSYGSILAGPPKSLYLADAALNAAGAYAITVVPSRPIQLTFTLSDMFGSRVRGDLPTDMIVLQNNLTTDSAPYSSSSDAIDLFDFVIDALPGSVVPVRFSTIPPTSELEVAFTITSCDVDKEWSEDHKRCVVAQCPAGQYVARSAPASVPTCSVCPPNCSERRFWTYSVSTSCAAKDNSRAVVFRYVDDAMVGFACRTTSLRPGDTADLISACGPGGDMPSPFRVDCDYMTASNVSTIAVTVAAVFVLLLATGMIAMLVLQRQRKSSSIFSWRYSATECVGLVFAVLPVFTVFDGERLTNTKCALMFLLPLIAFLLVAMPMWCKLCFVHRVLLNRRLVSMKRSGTVRTSTLLSLGVAILAVLLMVINDLRSKVVIDSDNIAGLPVGRMECVLDNENQALIILLLLAVLTIAVQLCQMTMKLKKLASNVPEIVTIGIASIWMTVIGASLSTVYLLHSNSEFETKDSFVLYCVGLMVTFTPATLIDCSMLVLTPLGIDVRKLAGKVAPLNNQTGDDSSSTGALTTSFDTSSSTKFTDAAISPEQLEQHFKTMQEMAFELQVLKLENLKLMEQLASSPAVS